MKVAGVIADLLARGHAVQFEARGDSMDPVIRDHDVLHVEPGKGIGRGDVVLVLAARGLTAHRVVSRKGTSIITRGDNAPSDDDAVEVSQVLGKVIYALRDGKRIEVGRTLRSRATSVVRRLRQAR